MKIDWLAKKFLILNDKITDNRLEKIFYQRLKEKDFSTDDFGTEEIRYIRRTLFLSQVECSSVLFTIASVLSSFKVLQDRRKRRLTKKPFFVLHAVNLFLTFNLLNYVAYVYFLEKEPEFVPRLRERYLN